MKKLLLIGAVVGLVPLVGVLSLHAENKVDQAWVTQNLTAMPLAFTQNNGQWDERALFRVNAGGATMWLTADGMHYQFTRRIPGGNNPDANGLDSRLRGNDKQGFGNAPVVGQADSRPDVVSTGRDPRGFDDAPDSLETLVIKAAFAGANSNPEMVGLEEMEYRCNYFLGNDPAKWRTDVPNYRAVVLKSIYEGIDLKYYGNGDGKMEYDFIVSPGADISQIRVQYQGVNSVSVDGTGRLVVSTTWTDVIEERPRVYQFIDGREVTIEGAYVTSGGNAFGFRLGKDYDPAQPVVIDPVLSYSTYLGGGSFDCGYDIVVDASGAAYVTGETESTDFPTFNPYQGTNQGVYDVFVTKLSSGGNSLVYSTYLGGTGNDRGCGIAVDSSGAAYVTGYTGRDFPTVNPYQGDQGDYDAFVAKLSSTGNSLIYSTYLGGGSEDYGYGIAVDASGAAYVTGTKGYSSNYDAFVAKLSSTGDSLIYSTCLGGDSEDQGYGIAVDGSGAAYVTGRTTSSNFPTLNPYQGANRGSYDAFVTKLSSDGNNLVFSTYLGGNAIDYVWDIAVDGSGAAYVTGWTMSNDFPTLNSFQATLQGGYAADVFVTKLSRDGNSLIYSTYLGGGNDDFGYDIAVDDSGAAYVMGNTASTDFPTLNAYQSILQGWMWDIFVTKLSRDGNSLIYSTYLGGGNDDFGWGIAVNDSGAAYVTGSTWSTDFPILNPYQEMSHADPWTYDAFITKLIIPPCCIGTRGNANGDVLDKVTVSDVTYLLAWMFGIPSGPAPACMEEANVNGDLTPQGGEKVSVSDVTYLLNYLFGIPSGPAPKPCP